VPGVPIGAVFRDKYPDVDVLAPITVGDSVFIGANAIVLPGVTIGSNSVIGAGSVVAHDIPCGSVAAGVPARVVKTVDDYERAALRKSLNCGRLSPIDKALFLKARYGAGNDTSPRGPESCS
jgi:acetyltransferase-like isoleucine patch superfamily enzyme